MNSLLLAVMVACTNCSATGWVQVPCSACSGEGVTYVSRRFRGLVSKQSVPCSRCTRGLVNQSAGGKGTGKVRRTCPICKGRKKIDVKAPVSR